MTDNPCAEIINPFGIRDEQNPLGLGSEYTWEAGDTFMLIALKYRRPSQWLELLDLNKRTLQNNRYLMCTGDNIEVHHEWFPLPTYEYNTKFRGSHGTRIIEA